MSTTPTTHPSNQPATALYDPKVAGRILLSDSGIEWPCGHKPLDVRIERAWPGRCGHLAVEWSLAFTDGLRRAVFALSCDGAPPHEAPTGTTPIITADGIRGLGVDVPAWRIRIHSPDRDGGLPHLARCLDGHEMGECLAPYWNREMDSSGREPGSGRSVPPPCRMNPAEGAAAQPLPHSGSALQEDDNRRESRGSLEPPAPVDCRLIGYRAGRRATLVFRSTDANGAPRRLVGKTFHDDRAERLLSRHADLNRQLIASSGGRVRVSTPVGLVPELGMALFAWNHGHGAPEPDATEHGEETDDDSRRLAAPFAAGVDALAALHNTVNPDLPEFTIADECRVLARWHDLLVQADADTADAIRPLLDALLSASRSVSPNPPCTVHRDFYERQFIHNGRTTVLLDLDTLARADPCVDWGNFLAHMFLAGLRAAISPDSFARLAGMMLRRTLGHGQVFNDRTLAYYWASSLFRIGAVHVPRATTGRYARSLWRLCAELVRVVDPGVEAGLRTRTLGPAPPDPRPILEEWRK